MAITPLTWQNCRYGVAVAGAHGGAGTSTIHTFLPSPAYDLGCLKQPDGVWQKVETYGRPLVVVARATVPGVQWAAEAIRELAAQHYKPACLVLVSDGWKEPREATLRVHLLEPRVGAVVRMPFLRELRVVHPNHDLRLPRKAQNALASIVQAAEKAASQCTPLTSMRSPNYEMA